MAQYEFSDYAIFEDGCGTVKVFNESLSTNTDSINKCKSELNNESVFMGPICDSCVEGFEKSNSLLKAIATNFDTIASYLTEVATAYKNGDENASSKILSINDGVVSSESSALSADTTLTGGSNEEKIYNYLKSQGFNNAAISGILANIEYESGFKTTLYGDGGTSYGLCQWHNNRFTRLKNYCSSNGLDYKSLDGQLSYLVHELKNNYSSIYNSIKNVPNTKEGAYKAAEIWTRKFEVPANPDSQSRKRGSAAQSKYWSKYGSA